MLSDLGPKIDMMFLKGTLIEIPRETLPDMFSTQEDYKMFLVALNNIITTDPDFFLIYDELLKKAEDTVYKQRFTYQDTEINDLINEIVVGFNEIKNVTDQKRQERVRLYVAEQEANRNDLISDTQTLLNMIANDAALMESMLMSTTTSWKPRYFISSTNYFINTIPEFYEEFDELKNQTINNIKIIKKNKKATNFFIRHSAKKTIKAIQKLKTKEE